MSDFVIIPDASCDLSAEMCRKYDIPDIARGTITFPDGSNRKVDLEWETISPEEFYDLMKNKNNKFMTSTPILEEEVEIFKKYLAMGKDIITFSLSSALSGTYNVAIQAGREALKDFPDRRIYNVDSRRYSTSMGLLVIAAAKLRLEGKTFDEVVEWSEKHKHFVHQMGPMDDLFFLAHAGRINNFKAFFGTMAGVNPMADFNRNGLSEVLVKCKGKAMAFDVSLEYIKRTITDPENALIIVSHTNRKAHAEIFAEKIRNEIKPKELIVMDVGMSCGANIGPGLVAAFYFGKEISEDLAEEKAIMKDIMDNYKAGK